MTMGSQVNIAAVMNEGLIIVVVILVLIEHSKRTLKIMFGHS